MRPTSERLNEVGAPTAATDWSEVFQAMPLWLKLVYAGVGIFPLALAWLPLDWIIHRFLYEDMFYYLGVARHILAGAGATADGTAPTNGFHPLWMLICVAAQFVAGSNWSIHVVLTVAALMHLIQGVLIFRIVSTVSSVRAGHMAALFWLANYRVIACNLCGLETPFGVLMVLAVALFLVLSPAKPGLVWAVRLGTLLGLAILARFDLALLAVVVVLALVLFLHPNTSLSQRVKLSFVASSVTGIVLIPWFVWSLGHSKALLPNSGAALSVWGFQHIEFNGDFAGNLAILRMQLFGGSWLLSDAANLFGLWPVALPSQAKLGLLVILVLLIATAATLRATRQDGYQRWRLLFFGYAWVHLSYYWLFAVVAIRYLMPFCALMIVLVASALEPWLATVKARTRTFSIYGGLCIIATLAGVSAWQQHQGAGRTHSGHMSLLRMAQWIPAHLAQGAILGGWNSGITSYFSERTVVNLDGVINDEAIAALRERTIDSYIAQRDIQYLVDVEGQISKFMDNYGSDPEWRGRYQLVHEIGSVQLLRRIPES